MDAYYKIDLRALPEVRAFAVKTETHIHRVQQAERDLTVCQISYLQTGAVTEYSKGNERVLEEGSIHAFAQNHRRKFVSDDNKHYEFNISFTLGSPAVILNAEELAQWTPQPYEAILPGYIADARTCQKLAPFIRKLVQDCRGSTAKTRHLQAYTGLFEILAMLTDYAIRSTQEEKTANLREAEHCRAACDYIAENLSRKLNIKDIAAHAGISYYYLCRLFPKVMGMNLTEYINREKLRQAQYLIAEVGLTVEQAGSTVGIDDPKYLSRLFRQYVGMTISEFKRLQKQ